MPTKSTKKKDLLMIKGSFDDVISASVSGIQPIKNKPKKLASSSPIKKKKAKK